ncbi:hypothetical protein BJ875DRAFT_68046 [Amylocarpus encephaloides]|uniref:Peptidase S54 rhomboid domain-containing protein n=1 Tax=Amylocarpus encephaloides TaxID=45428 RepID=A0A9P8C3R7_9HELO|nr:hypothetical protein BJ875DRAFT_68046 [Amylocarpus encephaloides]
MLFSSSSNLLRLRAARAAPIARHAVQILRVHIMSAQRARPFSSSTALSSKPPRSPRGKWKTPPQKHTAPEVAQPAPAKDDKGGYAYQEHVQKAQEHQQRHRDQLQKHANTPIYILIGACVAAFGGLYYTEQELEATSSQRAKDRLAWYKRNMIYSVRNVEEGRWWTAITSTFAHVNLLHLSFNMFSLYNIGPAIIAAIGLPGFAGIYFGAGAVGAAAQWYYWKKNTAYPRRNQSAVGASGCVFGLFGSMAMLMPKAQMTFFIIPMTMLQSSVATAVISVLCMKRGWLEGIGHADHLGGLAFGTVAGMIIVVLNFRRTGYNPFTRRF